MKKLRIIFIGTPDFAVAILKRILEQKYNVVAIITAPDKPAGRGRKIQKSAVKIFAKKTNIPILQPINLKDENFLKSLQNFRANLQIVVAFRMLPKVLWHMPKLGTFNIHASLLPAYRGAAPIHHSIISGEKITGVTTFFLNENIDTGAIILQKKTNIEEDETLGILYQKLMLLGSEICLETLDLIIKNKIKTTPQKENLPLKTAPKLTTEFCKIDWNMPLEVIYNKIRGLNPLPGAWCFLENFGKKIKVKIYDISKTYVNHNYESGMLFCDKKTLKVFVNQGFITIKKLKISGKKTMNIQDVCNGFSFEARAKFL